MSEATIDTVWQKYGLDPNLYALHIKTWSSWRNQEWALEEMIPPDEDIHTRQK